MRKTYLYGTESPNREPQTANRRAVLAGLAGLAGLAARRIHGRGSGLRWRHG